MVMLGVALFDWLYNALGSVMAFFYSLIPSYGFAIAMLTISVRVLLIPLTSKQVKSQRAMQQLQPELKKLQAKHKGDRQRLNEEMMKLYKEHKANPLAGCLPLILQMPLFIILYRLIIDLSKVPPRHIPIGSDLYQALAASSGKLLSFGIDLAKKPQSVVGLLLVAAVVATGYYQQKQMTARMSKDAINPQMQMVTKILPGFFGLISLSVPAGVVLYFVVSNVWQIGQQAVAFRNQPVRQGEDEAPKSVGSKSGGGSDGAGAGKGGGGGGAKPGGAGAAKSGGGGGAKKPGGAGAAKSGGGGGAKKPGGAGAAKSGGGGGTKKPGGTPRPPSGRVTPKGGGSGRVTPKGGPGGVRAGGGAGAGGSQKSGKANPEPAGPPVSVGESLLGRLTNRAAKSKRPPPAARPKGLPPTKGSSGGSSRKGS